MPDSIQQRLSTAGGLDRKTKQQLITIIDGLRKDIAALATKLNADAGVTDTNYNANPNVTA